MPSRLAYLRVVEDLVHNEAEAVVEDDDSVTVRGGTEDVGETCNMHSKVGDTLDTVNGAAVRTDVSKDVSGTLA